MSDVLGLGVSLTPSFALCVLLSAESRSLHMIGKCSSAELHHRTGSQLLTPLYWCNNAMYVWREIKIKHMETFPNTAFLFPPYKIAFVWNTEGVSRCSRCTEEFKRRRTGIEENQSLTCALREGLPGAGGREEGEWQRTEGREIGPTSQSGARDRKRK